MRVYWAPASSMRISSSVWSLSAETFDSQPSSSSFIKTRQRCFRICRATSWRDAYSSGWYLVRNLSTTTSMHRNQNWRQWTSYSTGCPPTQQRQIDENTVVNIWDAPIIGIGQLSAVLPIIRIGRLLDRYRPIVIYYVLRWHWILKLYFF